MCENVFIYFSRILKPERRHRRESMNDRLAEGLQKNPVFQIATKSEDCLSAVFAYVNKNINKEEENTERNKQKTREFLAFASWNTDFCNPGALGHSSLSSSVAAVYFNKPPAVAGYCLSR